jgi:hypothetical protein
MAIHRNAPVDGQKDVSLWRLAALSGPLAGVSRKG